MECETLVVGAGLFGAVVAERIANDLGRHVLVIDKRGHTGGNCHSLPDPDTGIDVHAYGTHIFHTDSSEAWAYLSQFAELNGYHHQVLTRHRGRVYQMPINLETINSFYDRQFSPCEAREFIRLEAAKEGIASPGNMEEAAVASLGRPLYEAFIRGYTLKQWAKEPRDLPASIRADLPLSRLQADRARNAPHSLRRPGIYHPLIGM